VRAFTENGFDDGRTLDTSAIDPARERVARIERS
jgi:hypothetical protein